MLTNNSKTFSSKAQLYYVTTDYIVIYENILKSNLKKYIIKIIKNNSLTIRKYCRLPYFQELGKFNHKSGIGLRKNVIYSTIFKQVLKDKRVTHTGIKKAQD